MGQASDEGGGRLRGQGVSVDARGERQHLAQAMNPSPRRALAMGSASRLSVALTQCAVHCVARIFAGLCPTRPYPNPKPVIERTSLRRLSLLALHACARTRAVGLEHARRRAHFSGESRQSLAKVGGLLCELHHGLCAQRRLRGLLG